MQKILKVKKSYFCILFLIYSLNIHTQNELSQKTIEILDSIAIQDVPVNAPGIATAVIKNGTVIYEKYVGFADFSDSSYINKCTRFNIASNGKQFTALAILTLIEKGQIKITDDIRKFLPHLYRNIHETITIEQLLNHTSGIRDCYDLWPLQGYTWWKESFNNQDVINLIEKQSALNFRPGTKYLYSNTNYILLASVIEIVTKISFSEYTRKIFKDLKMNNTSFECDYLKIKGPLAKSYFNFNTWTSYDWIWNVCGDGNFFSTLEDLVLWEKLVQGRGATSNFYKKIIKKSQQLIKNSTTKNYGYGLEFGKYKGLNYRFHEGATGAWKATVLRFDEKNISFITLTNTGKAIPYNQTRQMADVIFNLKSGTEFYRTEPLTVGSFVTEDEICGTYLTQDNFAFTFFKDGNKFFLRRAGRNDVELEREADNIFHQKFDKPFKQEFIKSSDGALIVNAYYTSHAPYTLIKTKGVNKDFNFQSLEGQYVNDETNVGITVKHNSDLYYDVTFNNKSSRKGLLVSESQMLVDFYNFQFTDGFIFLSGDRIKNIKFERKY